MNEQLSFESNYSVPSDQSFWTTVTKKLRIDSAWESIKNSQELLINIGISAGIGIIVGFLFKRYGSFFITFALIVAGIIILAQFDLLLVSINWSKAYNLAGLPQTNQITSESFFLALWDWVKDNVQLVVSGVIGFLIGLKIG